MLLLWSCQSVSTSSPSVPVEKPFVIYINDDGSLKNRSGLTAYCDKMKKTPQTVVVFIHGWHGTASPPDGNVQAFMNNLEKVRQRSFRPYGRTVTGIAVEWKARTLPGFLETPVYHVTRGRADKISRADGISDALLQLADAQKGTREHFIVTGHSMGARILGRVIRKHPELLKTADLVLMANTADSSSSFRRTLDSVVHDPYPRGRLPKLVWVTSAHDIVTRIIYPPFNGGSAPGHDPRVVTYDVKLTKRSDEHHPYSAEVTKVSDQPNLYAHDIRITDGLGGHSDIWSEAMNQIVNYYVVPRH